jgi:ubiquinone/menaquinone biosynthesis C-methylase UbiE
MALDVCPWWLSYVIDNYFRRRIQNPEKILEGHVDKGQTVIDIGCGAGLFSIAMAKLVGEEGRVISVDLQKRMLDRLRRRARRAGLISRIHLHQCEKDGIGVAEHVDFALAAYMVHEVPDQDALLKEIAGILKPEAHFLLIEPKVHVSSASFRRTVEAARAAGMKPCSEPEIRMSRAVLFVPD